MPEIERLLLIIDANNLAHHVYHIPRGRVLSEKEISHLSHALANYASRTQPAVSIELCFDPLPPEKVPADRPMVRCLVAPVGGEADDLVRERVWFHHHRGVKYLAITNDGRLLDEILEERGWGLQAHFFVRRAGTTPVFRTPEELAAVPKQRPAKPLPDEQESIWDLLQQNDIQETPSSLATRKTETTEESPSSAPAPPLSDSISPADADAFSQPETGSILAEPVYRLTFDTWNPEAGLRFLLDSFCKTHQADEDWQLFHSMSASEIRPADLRYLAGLLRSRCGGEAGFAQHGALMKRVRLALILSDTFTLSQSELIAITGLPALGLKGRIRGKAMPWLEILIPGE